MLGVQGSQREDDEWPGGEEHRPLVQFRGVGRAQGARASQVPQVGPKNARVEDEVGIERVCGVSLAVRSGEIVGIAGVEGNGQSELAEAIMHVREIQSGRALLGDEPPQTGWMPEEITIHGNQIVLRQA